MNKIKEIWNWATSNDLTNSLQNGDNGYSLKKLTAVIVVSAYVYLHFKVDETTLNTTLMTDAGLICALFGISTYHQLKLNKEDEDNK